MNPSAVLLVMLGMSATVSTMSDERTPWGCGENDGAPFGQVGDDGSRDLMVFAHAHGLELQPALDHVYAGDRKSLERLLRFALTFDRIDVPARAYGNLVYSIFLNLGERKGPQIFLPVMTAQDPAVRQRIRDILWHPLLCDTGEHRAGDEPSTRKSHSSIWPSDFVFGRGDGVFGDTPPGDLKPPGK